MSEQEGIAALEPHNGESAAALGDQQLVDLALRQPLARHPERVRRRLGNQLRRDEPVVEQDLAAADELEPTHGYEAGIARTGADERDRHGKTSLTRSAK